MDTLTPKLTVDQIKQNIDALKSKGLDDAKIQSYVDNYSSDGSGGFIRKDIIQQRQARIDQGLPVSVNPDKVEPTLAGSIVRGLVQAPLSTLLSVAAPVNGDKGLTVHSKYLGNTSDITKNINDKATELAGKVNSGDMSTGRAVAGILGESALQTANVASLIPFAEGAGAIKGTIAGTTAAESAVPALTKAQKAIQLAKQSVEGAGVGYGFDVANNLANTDKTTGQSLIPGVGTLIGAATPGVIAGTMKAGSGAIELAGKGKQLASNVATKTGDLVSSVSPKAENIMSNVARINPTDATTFKQMAGKTHGQYLVDTGNFGTPDQIIKKEAEKFAQSVKDVDATLAKLPGTYQPKEAIDVADALTERLVRVKSPEAKRAIELSDKLKTKGLDMSEMNELKRLYERNVKLVHNKAINPDAVALATNMDNSLRNWQFAKADELGFSNIAEMNKQTQMSRFIVDKLGAKAIKNDQLNGVGLSDWIMLSGGNPTAVGGFLTKKFFSDPGVQAKMAKMLSKTEAKGAIKPIVGETKLLRLEAPKESYKGTKVTAPINLPKETVTSAEKRIQKNMGITRSVDTRIPKQLLGLPSPSGKIGVIELPGVGTFNKNKYTKSGIIEVINAKIKNPSDRRKLVNILNDGFTSGKPSKLPRAKK